MENKYVIQKLRERRKELNNLDHINIIFIQLLK